MNRTTLTIAFIVATMSACATQQSSPTATPESQLCVVRHAEAFKNLDPPPPDLTPEELDSLTTRGEEQARELLDDLPDGVAQVRTSPAQRARQTAELIGGSLAVVVESRLGQLEGDVPWDARLSSWSNGEDPRPKRGESLADGANRVNALLSELRAELEPGDHVVVVTHGDISSILLGELRGTPLLKRPVKDEIGTGEMTCVPLQQTAAEGAR